MSKTEVTLENQESVSETISLNDLATNILIDVDTLSRRAWSNKKVSKDLNDIKGILGRMNQFIFYFNSLDEMRYTAFVQNIGFDSINIPREFSDFIIPASVRRDSTNLRCKNLLHREESAQLANSKGLIPSRWDYIEFINVCDDWRAIFKKDMSTDTVKLSELKKNVTTESVIDRLAFAVGESDRVKYSGEPFVPLVLSVVGNEFEERYFTNTVDEVMTDWYANFKF